MPNMLCAREIAMNDPKFSVLEELSPDDDRNVKRIFFLKSRMVL